MLSENIRQYRKAKGLSQEELAIKLNVVRQTVSKWEKGLSVPDSEMLVALAEALDTTVSTLLDETTEPQSEPSLQSLAAKLEVLNEQFAKQARRRKRIWRTILIVVICLVALHMAIYLWVSFQMTTSIDQSVAVIGGSDGPTAIFVAAPPFGKSLLTLLLDVLLIVGGIIGIVKTK